MDRSRSFEAIPQRPDYESLANRLLAELGIHPKNFDSSVLDEYVNDIFSSMASDVNNGGLNAQVAVMIEHLGIEGARHALLEARENGSEPA